MQFNQPITPVVRNLLILNVLMFFGTYVLLGSETWDSETGEYISQGRLLLAAYMPGSQYFQPFQIVTHMFMHADIGHLFFNMLTLFFFGPMVEYIWGARRFLIYYLACGLGAWAIHTGVMWWELSHKGIDPVDWNGATLGASGAIFGVLTAFAYLFPDRVISLIFPPISLKAKYFVPIMAAAELFYGIRGAGTGVAHFAHVGGALVGFLIIKIFYPSDQNRWDSGRWGR